MLKINQCPTGRTTFIFRSSIVALSIRCSNAAVAGSFKSSTPVPLQYSSCEHRHWAHWRRHEHVIAGNLCDLVTWNVGGQDNDHGLLKAPTGRPTKPQRPKLSVGGFTFASRLLYCGVYILRWPDMLFSKHTTFASCLLYHGIHTLRWSDMPFSKHTKIPEHVPKISTF